MNSRYGDRAEASTSGRSYAKHSGYGQEESNKVPRHPPWLKGKEIGLFYRNKSRHKKNHPKKRYQAINLHVNVKRCIQNALNNFATYYNSLQNNTLHKTYTNSKLENKYLHINDSQFKRNFLSIVTGNIQEILSSSVPINPSLERISTLDDLLLSQHKIKQSFSEYEKMMKFRKKLPVYQKRLEILETVEKNQIIVISGETGCGKTTQIPQYILDDQIERGNGSITRIICTQPRRISAVSIAERVAAERVEKLGESVGFQIRLEKSMPRERGSILFCTTGILLQLLQFNLASMEFSHIVLDEIHERTIESDFILALLKLITCKRPSVKVLLMSATLNSERFSEYYDGCPMIHIPGFVYPVQEIYLEDILTLINFVFPTKDFGYRCWSSTSISMEKYKENIICELKNLHNDKLTLSLIEQLIQHICETKDPGAILVFLPGIMDIIKLNTIMVDDSKYKNQCVIYLLHSRMPTIDQKAIFDEPPNGLRKIILATSIAEASITIEDVVYVIDSGRMKYNKFNPETNIHSLQLEWVTVANAKQRKGRAGRVKSGICYHLYTRNAEEMFDKYPLPEMLRAPLEQIILQIKILQLGDCKSFLSCVMDPPNLKSIDLSLKLLRTLNALDSDENLTPLGYHLAQLPLDPRIGKMIIWGALFSCIQPIFAIAASLSFKDAFCCPLKKEKYAQIKKLDLSQGEFSDHIALSEALRRFEIAYKQKCAGRFCEEYCLSFNTLQLLNGMKNQYVEYLHKMKFLETSNPYDTNANKNSKNKTLVKAIVCAVMYPNVAVIRNITKGGVTAMTIKGSCVSIHPSSVNNDVVYLPSPFLTYFTMQQSKGLYIHDTTCVTYAMLLFAIPMHIYTKKKVADYEIKITDRNFIICNFQTGLLIQKLQKQFENILEYKMTHPGVVTWDSVEGELLNAIIHLVCQNNEQMGIVNSEIHINERY